MSEDMKVAGNRIIKIEESDIINGTFKLPKGVTVIGDNACKGNTLLTTIPDGVTTIGNYAFEGCTSLTTIPDSVTTIEFSAFLGCTSLTTIPDSVTTIGEAAFANCTSLTTIPDSVTAIGNYAFADCTSLTTIPDSVTAIGNYAFRNCTSLTTIPDSVTTIGEFAFADCTSLRTIPDSVTAIGNYAFKNCTSLTTIPDSVTTIGEFAFAGCTSLRTIPDSVTTIGEFAFAGCTSLRTIPDSVTTIGDGAFADCTSLETIYLKEINKIRQNAFSQTNIQKIVTPYGEMKLQESSSQCIIQSYLYLYANSILRNPYKNIDEFLDNNFIDGILNSDIIYKDDAVQKFKQLFYKFRRTWDMFPNIFKHLSFSLAKKFELKTWNQIKDLRYWGSDEMSKVLVEMMEVFGLFEKDDKQSQRFEKFKNFVEERPFILTEEEYRRLNGMTLSDMNQAFIKENIVLYRLKEEMEIPEEFLPYIRKEMYEKDIHFLKKLSGNYGKRINDFLKENYEIVETKGYKLKEEEYQNTFYKEDVFNAPLIGHINYGSLHRIFDGCVATFNPDFCEFFLEHIHIILQDEKIQAYVKEIQRRFEEIQNHYAYTSGSKKIHLKQAIDYVKNVQFHYHPGNEEVANKIQAAGVVSQEAFEYYQDAYEKNQKRKKSSLIKRKNRYTIEGFVIQTELLRKDEIDAALVGEVNYTNCCQAYKGVGHNCMAHAVYSDDGGVFTTKLIADDKEILLTQSWDWQNNNVYCHDNIEGTPYLKGNSKLQLAVMKAFQLDGEAIIQKSQQEIEAYIKIRRKAIEKSLMSDTEKEEELRSLKELEERQVIRVVTSGAGNNDVSLSSYFPSSIQVNEDLFLNGNMFTLKSFQPVEYNEKQAYFDKEFSNYTDSKQRQYIIAGSLENLCLGKQEPLVAIYKDERRVVEEKEIIRDYTFHKIQTIEKEAYPKEMWQFQVMSKDSFIEEYPNVYLGEDWYMIYEEKDEQTVYISCFAKRTPELEEERKEQLDEMSHAVMNLLEQYEVIEADFKEDTSYLLYLMNQKRGIVEQIGEDKKYMFNKDSERTVVSLEEQEELLKSIKQVRASKNPEQIMHHVTFKKGKRWNKNIQDPISRKR